MFKKPNIGWLKSLLSLVGDPTQEVAPSKLSTFFVRDGYSLKKVDARIHRKSHRLTDIGSLVNYCHRYGDPSGTTVYCDEDRFVAVIDDQTCDQTINGGADRDWIEMIPRHTDAMVFWEDAFRTGVFSHVKFRYLIEDRIDDGISRGFVSGVKGFVSKKGVEYSADMGAGNTIKVISIDKSGTSTENGIVELDREFTIKIPVILGWEKTYKIHVRVEPVVIDSGVAFRITAKNMAAVKSELIDDLVAATKRALDNNPITSDGEKALTQDWLVVRGLPSLGRTYSNL